MMNLSNKLLSDIVAFRTYARYLPHLSRRESLEETINRNMVMHLDRFPSLSKDIIKAYSLVHEMKVMPSMRSLQFSGQAINQCNFRNFNCSFCAIDDARAFSEILYLLLAGTGVGFSVQHRHVDQLPKVGRPREENPFKIHDSIMGWAQALGALTSAYFFNSVRPVFDYSGIRPQGARLVTSGAKAPGPDPLRHMLDQVELSLRIAAGRKLKPIEVHDVICMISDCVLAGGVRRSALISLFDRDDKEMLKAKSGDWWVKHPYRARANNSAVLPRKEVTREEFDSLFKVLKEGKCGEPGFFWTSNPELGTNPCCEISLNSMQLCNLTSINQTGVEDKQDLLRRASAASLIGTLQASYTDFPFVRSRWKEITDKEALLGVSFTGIADAGDKVEDSWLKEAAETVKETNERIARKIGINIAARTTCVKPEGTCSTVVGSSSGIHSRHSRYYLRRIRMNKIDDLAHYLSNAIPDLVEEDVAAANTIVVTIPQESPAGAIAREDETAKTLLERVVRYNTNWVRPGHRAGDNYHNVSCTISVKDNEWDDVQEFMWKNRTSYAGIAILPYDGGSFKQAPFEACTKETYEKFMGLVKEIDLKQVVEMEDLTTRTQTIACAGGVCSLE